MSAPRLHSECGQETRPRYAAEFPLPSYSYVSGMHPRPAETEGDLAGESLTATSWQHCRSYLHGVDLFNHGYYWEAHERWELLWISSGRQGCTADFLKALIKLAAAGVKAREGRPGGVKSHAQRAATLLAKIHGSLPDVVFGIDLGALAKRAAKVAESATSVIDTTPAPVRIVLPILLELRESP